MPRVRPARSAYPHFQTMTTRWRDNDVYAHMNNAVYYEYIDTVVNHWILSTGTLDIPGGPIVGLVAETGCVFHASVGFPGQIDAGLRVARIGRSSVIYEVGLFGPDAREAAAEARFVHVYVERRSQRPTDLPPQFREALQGLLSA